jgi:hypothetical protein
MNEVALHRGSSPHLNTIDAYVDGQHLTEAVVSNPQKINRHPSMTVPSLVGWFDCFHTNRLYSLLPLRGWPNCPPVSERPRSYTDLPS